jgi:hypothetical protein
MTTEQRMRKAVRLVVATLRAMGDGHGEIRRKLRDGFHMAMETPMDDGRFIAAVRRSCRDEDPAMGDTPDPGFAQDITSGATAVGCVSLAGIFRLIFVNDGIDYRNPYVQERWWSIAERHLGDALADPNCVMG